jgi:hypothetical protein
LLKRSLRNGTASVDHSLNHRAPSDRLMPAPEEYRKHKPPGPQKPVPFQPGPATAGGRPHRQTREASTDRQVGAAVEADFDLPLAGVDVSAVGMIDEVAESLPGLGPA